MSISQIIETSFRSKNRKPNSITSDYRFFLPKSKPKNWLWLWERKSQSQKIGYTFFFQKPKPIFWLWLFFSKSQSQFFGYNIFLSNQKPDLSALAFIRQFLSWILWLELFFRRSQIHVWKIFGVETKAKSSFIFKYGNQFKSTKPN